VPPALAAGMDASTAFQPQQIVDGRLVPTSTQPRGVETLGADAREHELESGGEVVAEETVGIVPPQRREDPQAHLFRDPIHSVVLVIRGDRPDHDPVYVDSTEDPAQGIELAYLTGLGHFRQEG